MSRGINRKTRCSHVVHVQLTWAEIRTKKKEKFCRECKDSSSNQWLCLHNYCQFVGCGHRSNDHIAIHAKTSNHPLAINLHNEKIFCHECDVQLVLGENIPPFYIKESDCPNHLSNSSGKNKSSTMPNLKNGSVPSNSASHQHISKVESRKSLEDIAPPLLSSSSTSSAYNYAPFIAGAVGLRNFGNTCYMNAALQALSNCPQLNQIFLEGPTIHSPQTHINLASAFQNLLRDMWNPQPTLSGTRNKVIVPSQVSSSFKMLHSTFRSYAQQDTQEFLRLFLDRLHEETKEPVTKKAAEDLGILVPLSASVNSNQQSQPPRDKSSKPSSKRAKTSAANNSSSTTTTKSLSPNTLSEVLDYRSVISDVFRGTLCNTCVCLNCGYTSTVIEPFFDLSVPIAGTAPESATLNNKPTSSSSLSSSSSSQSPHDYISNENSKSSSDDYSCNYNDMRISRTTTTSASNNNNNNAYDKPGWWPWFLTGIKSWFISPKITLQNCLDAYFSDDLLTQENQYYCERCKRLCDAKKRCYVKHLPEVLCVHLKRFRHDFSLSSKLTNQVIFPLFGLDMKPYLSSSPSFSSSWATSSSTSSDEQNDNDNNCVSQYELFAVICHWGSGGSFGHYTCYALNNEQQQWYEYDDETVQPCDPATVTSLLSQAYVLFYRKNDDACIPLRIEASTVQQDFLEHPQDTLLPFYVDRSWILKFNTFSEPGPITNARLLCAEHQQLLPNYKNASDILMPLSSQLWNMFLEKFGGGPAISSLHVCAQCHKIREEIRIRREKEYSYVSKAMNEFRLSRQSCSLYAIDHKWFFAWENFAKGINAKPPGPIDNSSICRRSSSTTNGNVVDNNQVESYSIVDTGNFGKVNGLTWRFLHGIYGGGPVLCLQKSAETSSVSGAEEEEEEADSDEDVRRNRGDHV